MQNIKYLKHSEIDFKKWDLAIDKSYNALVYPYAFFLNSMADKKWDALVLGDYEAVFPLVWNRKFGFKYLYQPYFCQQLGLFSRTKITDSLLQSFIEKIPGSFRYWNFHLNYENKYFSPLTKFVSRTSFCIDLNNTYTDIYDKYNSDAKKNLAKAAIQGYDYRKNIEVKIVSECFFETYGLHYPDNAGLKQKITDCAIQSIQLEKGFTRAIYGNDGSLWCAGFFFFSNKRIHYAMAAPTEEGKKYGATHILIDEVLKEFALTLNTFDFEGSDIKSVAYFYSKFGSTPQHYTQIIRNRLPWWCRFLKE